MENMEKNLDTVIDVFAPECSICLTPFESLEDEFSTLSCGCQFCHQCVKAHVQEKISNGIIEISCLNIFCNGVMVDEEIQKFCDDHMHRRIKTMRKHLEVARDETRVWCPTRDCETICQIHLSITGDDVIVKCDQCNREHNLSRPNEEDVLEHLMGTNENIILCPKCKILIEKNGGCRLVTCKNCFAVFNDKYDVVVFGNIRHFFLLFLLVACLYFGFLVLSRIVSRWFFIFAVPMGYIWAGIFTDVALLIT